MKKNMIRNYIFAMQTALVLLLAICNAEASQSIFTDPSAGSCTDLAPSNTGNGTCSIGTVTAFNQSETITFTATSSGPNASFSVTGSVSGFIGTVTSGGLRSLIDPYGFTKFTVTLSDGGTSYVAGDNFTVAITQGSELKASNFNLFDLGQVCSNGCTPGAVMLFGSGSASAPTVAGSSFSNTGLYWASGPTLGVAISGAALLDISATSNVWRATSLALQKSNSGAVDSFTVNNSSNTAAAGSLIEVISGGTSATSNAIFRSTTTGGEQWAFGTDNGNSGRFSLAHNSNVGSSDFISVDTIGRFGVLNGQDAGTVFWIDNSGSTHGPVSVQQQGLGVKMIGSSTATTGVNGIISSPGTAASAFTAGFRVAFEAANRTKGAGSTITRDIGFLSDQQTQGTNNAFFSDNTSFTGSWALNFSSTNSSRLSGALGIAGNPAGAYLYLGDGTANSFLSTTSQIGIDTDGVVAASSATSQVFGVRASASTANASFTVPVLAGLALGNNAKGASSTVTRGGGIYFQNGATNIGAANSAQIFDNTSFSGDYFINSTSTRESLISGDLRINTAGTGVLLKEGSNAKMGRCTLVGGTCTVSTNKVTASSEIFLTSQVDGGTPGFLRVSARTAATSFVVTSSSGTDTSTVAWLIMEPS